MIEIDTERFCKIESGIYRIGVADEVIQSVSRRLTDNEVKIEYLYNSFPEHAVETGTKYISSYPVTMSEFERFVYETDYITEAETDGWGWVWDNGWVKRGGVSWRAPFIDSADEVYFKNKDRIPVLQVSWNDVSFYCDWMSDASSMKVRLPSEYEWEIFALRNGVRGMGEIDLNGEKNIFNNSLEYMDEIIRVIKGSRDIILPGLVWEWCDDWFDSYPGGIKCNEFGRVYKVLKGGSLLSHPLQHAREYRFRRCPTARSAYYGFRIALE